MSQEHLYSIRVELLARQKDYVRPVAHASYRINTSTRPRFRQLSINEGWTKSLLILRVIFALGLPKHSLLVGFLDQFIHTYCSAKTHALLCSFSSQHLDGRHYVFGSSEVEFTNSPRRVKLAGLILCVSKGDMRGVLRLNQPKRCPLKALEFGQ